MAKAKMINECAIEFMLLLGGGHFFSFNSALSLYFSHKRSKFKFHPLPGSGHSSSRRKDGEEEKGQRVRPTRETPWGTE